MARHEDATGSNKVPSHAAIRVCALQAVPEYLLGDDPNDVVPGVAELDEA